MAVTPAERDVVELATLLVDGSDPRMHRARLSPTQTSTGLSEQALAAIQRVLGRGVARAILLGAAEPPWPDAPPLTFGSASLDLLHWLHGASMEAPAALVLRTPPTAAESLLLVRVVELAAALDLPPPDATRRSAWCWLLAGAHLAPHGPPEVGETDAAVVLARDRWLIRALQPRLRDAWDRWARAGRAADLALTVAHGEAQRAWADLLLGALAEAEAPELAGFLAELGTRLAALPAAVWRVPRASKEVPLPLWQRARLARVAIPRALVDHLGRWGDQWRSTGFVDDGYELAQQRLARFEAPLQGVRRLRDLVSEAERLPEVG